MMNGMRSLGFLTWLYMAVWGERQVRWDLFSPSLSLSLLAFDLRLSTFVS